MQTEWAAAPLFTPPKRRRGAPQRVGESHVGRRSVVSFVGELDIASAPDLERALTRAIERGATDVWTDLSSTTFMDSSGVHCLLRTHRMLRELRRRFAVICGDGPVRRVLTLTRADAVLELHADRTTAHRAA